MARLLACTSQVHALPCTSRLTYRGHDHHCNPFFSIKDVKPHCKGFAPCWLQLSYALSLLLKTCDYFLHFYNCKFGLWPLNELKLPFLPSFNLCMLCMFSYLHHRCMSCGFSLHICCVNLFSECDLWETFSPLGIKWILTFIHALGSPIQLKFVHLLGVSVSSLCHFGRERNNLFLVHHLLLFQAFVSSLYFCNLLG